MVTKVVHCKKEWTNSSRFEPQHLYLISDREIKMDDWYMDDTNAVRKCIVDDKGYWSKRTHYKKIEATTDSSLSLPIIQQSFIEKYVSAQGEIDAVNIEMEFGYPDTPYTGSYIPKLREDGTVVIETVKDIWNKEEIIELIKQFHKDHPLQRGIQFVGNEVEDWIEQKK